jgi:hypothetical protein
MYHYNIEEVANSYKLKEKADLAFKETVKNVENKAN